MTSSTVLSPQAIPAHVDPALVLDFDYFQIPGADIDPHAAWIKLQAGPRIIFTPHHGGHWIVTRGEDVATCLRDYTRFSSFPGGIPKEKTPVKMPPVNIDPPEHRAYRMLLAARFSPRTVAQMETGIRELTVSLIEDFRARGHCDFVGEFAFRMPVDVFMQLAALPASDRDWLLERVETSMRNPDMAVGLPATQDLLGYIGKVVAERRANPGDDLLSHIATAEIDMDGGRRLTDEELVAMGLLLLFAGLDTVASTLTFIARYFTTHPDALQTLRADRARVPDAIEELIRRHGVPCLTRSVIADMEFQGVAMKKGDLVLVPVFMHGLDPEQFTDPTTVQFDREKPHIGFGVGEHRCVGSHLARMELRIFMEEWLDRIGTFAVRPGTTPRCGTGSVLSVQQLELCWPV
jgi:cytochrome P450